MSDPVWVGVTPGIPRVTDFTATNAAGTPILINAAAGDAYYIDALNVPRRLRATGGVIPLVDGQIPPNFIQIADGSIVYVEV